jgi:putative phosphoesterase
MKIGIVGDTHGDAASWARAMDIFDSADLIIHTGDVMPRAPSGLDVNTMNVPELVQMINNSPIPVVIAKGETDSEIYELIIDAPMQFPYAVVNLEGLRVVACHGMFLRKEHMVERATKHGAQVFAFGHTHFPSLERVGEVILVNPGSPSLSRYELRGMPVPTVATIEDGRVRIHELEQGKAIRELAIDAGSER